MQPAAVTIKSLKSSVLVCRASAVNVVIGIVRTKLMVVLFGPPSRRTSQPLREYSQSNLYFTGVSE